MKEETNNEMDLLLRRLGRRPDVSVSEANGDVEHLDADELSAYAENVLPTAARARYTEHLAECARCRKLVVQLSSSAGVVPVVESVKAPASSALRKFLASLFSPLVLRYAVPALGVIVVAAIGMIVLRQKQNAGDSIAQNAEAPAARPFITPTTPEPETPAKQYDDQQPKEQVATRPSVSGSPENQIAGAAPAAPPPAANADEISTDAQAKKKEDQSAFATPPPVTAAPKPTVESEQEAKTDAREEASPARSANGPPAEKPKDAPAAETVRVEDRKAETDREQSASAKNKTSSTAVGIASLRAGVVSQPQGQRDDDTAGKDKDKAETKSVAGRRFQKQKGVWVDTAYDSSRTVFTVTRGSESYRALIADEPEIKKIAEQLKGEILLVWKDRTYRIR